MIQCEAVDYVKKTNNKACKLDHDGSEDNAVMNSGDIEGPKADECGCLQCQCPASGCSEVEQNAFCSDSTDDHDLNMTQRNVSI